MSFYRKKRAYNRARSTGLLTDWSAYLSLKKAIRKNVAKLTTNISNNFQTQIMIPISDNYGHTSKVKGKTILAYQL